VRVSRSSSSPRVPRIRVVVSTLARRTAGEAMGRGSSATGRRSIIPFRCRSSSGARCARLESTVPPAHPISASESDDVGVALATSDLAGCSIGGRRDVSAPAVVRGHRALPYVDRSPYHVGPLRLAATCGSAAAAGTITDEERARESSFYRAFRRLALGSGCRRGISCGRMWWLG